MRDGPDSTSRYLERHDGDRRTRDERILYAMGQAGGSYLRADDLSSVTGVPIASTYSALQRCARLGYIWSPERGYFSLTIRGREIVDGIAGPPSGRGMY